MPYHTIDSMNWRPKDDAVIPCWVVIKNCAACLTGVWDRVPLFSWFLCFWKFSCAKISAFSFIFSLFLSFLPNFTLFFLVFCLWPLTPLLPAHLPAHPPPCLPATRLPACLPTCQGCESSSFQLIFSFLKIFLCQNFSFFSFLFSLFLAYSPNFMLFFLIVCLWPLSALPVPAYLPVQLPARPPACHQCFNNHTCIDMNRITCFSTVQLCFHKAWDLRGRGWGQIQIQGVQNEKGKKIHSARHSQVSSIDMALALGARGCEFEFHQCQCSRENWVCLKFSWTRNSLLIVS